MLVDPLSMRTVLDLACVPPLECRATLISAASVDEVIADLRAMGMHAYRDDVDHVGVQLVEPLELVTAAREIAATSGAPDTALRAFAAAPCAIELFGDPQEPMRSAWRWLCDTLGLDSVDESRSLVVAAGGGRIVLDAVTEFLPRPVLALGTFSRGKTWLRKVNTELFDCDALTFDNEFGYACATLFRREIGWFVKPHSHAKVHINGVLVSDLERVTTGDRFQWRGGDREVVAVI